jgi:hypothetical protein
MPNILGITAFQSGVEVHEWWEWTLVAILAASALLGIIALGWTSYGSVKSLLQVGSTFSRQPQT